MIVWKEENELNSEILAKFFYDLVNVVVRKIQFLNNFRLKTVKCEVFCKGCEVTNLVPEQA